MGVLRVLLVFTCVMLIAPILAYFFMKSFIFEGWYQTTYSHTMSIDHLNLQCSSSAKRKIFL